MTIYGGDTLTCSSDSIYHSYRFQRWTFKGNKTAGVGAWFCDGVNVTDVPYISKNFSTSGIFRLGEDFELHGSAYGIYDNLSIWSGQLTDLNISDDFAASEYHVIIPVDTIAPALTSGVVQPENAGLILMSFDEDIDTSSTSGIKTGLAVTEDGCGVSIDSIAIFGGSLNIYLPDLTGGTQVIVAYTAPGSNGIQDTAGNKTASFTDTITNNLPAPAYAITHQWEFDNSMVDSIGDNNGTQVGTVVYSSSVKIAGTHSLDNTVTGRGVALGVVDLGDQFTISGWCYIPTPNNYFIRPLFVNKSGGAHDGFAIMINTYGTYDKKILVETCNGTSTLTASSYDNAIPLDSWVHWMVVVNKTIGQATLYVNGSDVTVSSLIRQDFSTNQAAYIGCWPNGNGLYGYEDDVQTYADLLGSDEATTLHENPGVRLGGTPTPPPNPEPNDTMFNIQLAVNFNNDNTGTYDYNQWKAEWFANGWSDGIVSLWQNGQPSCTIVDLGGGNKCMQRYFQAGTYGASNGIQWEPRFKDAGLDEIYFRYEMYEEPGLQYVDGSKIPGVMAFPRNFTAGEIPLSTDGFQAGAMARGEHDGDFADAGQIAQYVYYQDMSGVYGNLFLYGVKGGYSLKDHQGTWVPIRFVLL